MTFSINTCSLCVQVACDSRSSTKTYNFEHSKEQTYHQNTFLGALKANPCIHGGALKNVKKRIEAITTIPHSTDLFDRCQFWHVDRLADTIYYSTTGS